MQFTVKEIDIIFSNPSILYFVASGNVILRRPSLLTLFHKKGFKCDVCGAEISHFKVRSHKQKDKTTHCLIPFTANGIEMTKDHIIPKCAGGKDRFDNYIPMCKTCNSKWKLQYDKQCDLLNGIIYLTDEIK